MNHCLALQLSENKNITIPEDENCWKSYMQRNRLNTPDELKKLIVILKSQFDTLKNFIQHLEISNELNDAHTNLQILHRYISEDIINAEIN